MTNQPVYDLMISTRGTCSRCERSIPPGAVVAMVQLDPPSRASTCRCLACMSTGQPAGWEAKARTMAANAVLNVALASLMVGGCWPRRLYPVVGKA